MIPSEERVLVDRSKRDPAAFCEIFDFHFDSIFRYILHLIGDRNTAEDLASQTFLKALKNLWRFKWSRASLSPWLFRIAVNEVNAHLRLIQRHRTVPLERAPEPQADEGRRPDRALESREEDQARRRSEAMLHACIADLKPEEQNLIALRYFENLPFQEISRILCKREGSLRMRTSRALEKLRILLKKRGFDDETIGRDALQPAQARGRHRCLPSETAPETL